jgi:hypothetical protein
MGALDNKPTLIVICQGLKPPACWHELGEARGWFREVVIVFAEVGPWHDPGLPKTRWIQSPWGSRNRSRNLGARVATSPWLYFLDEDVRLPSVTSLHAAFARARSGVVAVAGPYGSRGLRRGWGLAYNALANAWAREGRFLAGHVLLRREWAHFDESLEHGGEEDRLLGSLPPACRVSWDEAFVAEHERSMTFREFALKAWQHGRARPRPGRESRGQALRAFFKLAPRQWPTTLVFQSILELGALFTSTPADGILTKTPRIPERSPENPFRADDRTL